MSVRRITIALASFASSLVLSGSAWSAPGACCPTIFGCCAPRGTCYETDLPSCPFNYQGDDTSCDTQCGACCTGQGCFDGEEFGCSETGGNFQGYGNFCESVKCPIPPTTTTSSTTTTTEPGRTTTTFDESVLCGDANDDDDITAADALIALKTAVGSESCPKVRCDYNGDDKVQATDALAILKAAIGLPGDPSCP